MNILIYTQQEIFKNNISLELSMHQQNKYDKKLSMMYIEQAFHHTIEVTNVSMMYKLNVKINKPIVLILNSISVIQHIIQHKDCMQLILNIQTLIQINVIVAGYGIFNQKYQLQQISKFFKTALSMNITSFDSIKKVCLQFPGWRSFTKPVIKNIMNFVRKCKFLQQFKLNLSHCVNLSKQTSDLEYQDTYYGPLCFKNQQFQALLNQICCITSDVFHKMELNFSGWESISKQFFQILIHYLSVININLRTLAEFNLNLNTWASNKSSQNILQNSIIDKFFKSFEDMNSLQLLQLDLRNWAQKFRVNRFKERLQQVAGGAKKQQNTSTMYMFSATGTYFGSQLRNKFNNLRVQIVE